MRLLITGANGYIGSNLVAKFKRNTNYDIIGISRKELDLNDNYEVKNFASSNTFDHIIHTAAIANSKDFENANEVLYNNINSTQNIIQNFPQAHHIFFSSIVVYKRPGNINSTESKVEPRSVYGVSKLTCENLYKAAEIINGTKSTIYRCCAVVGGQNYTHGLINDIIRKIKDNPNELELWGRKPGSVKPYIHIDDVYETIYRSISGSPINYEWSSVNNMVTLKSLSVLEVANIICKKYNVDPQIKFVPGKSWKSDNKTIKYRPGYRYQTTVGLNYNTSEEAIENLDKEIY